MIPSAEAKTCPPSSELPKIFMGNGIFRSSDCISAVKIPERKIEFSTNNSPVAAAHECRVIFQIPCLPESASSPNLAPHSDKETNRRKLCCN